MRVGILVSGGDCPGLNAAIRGAVLRGVDVLGYEMIGFIGGWSGVINNEWIELDRVAVRGISPLGGTILGTSRVSPFSEEAGGAEMIRARMKELALDGLITIGGNGTQTVALMLANEGLPVIGLPKTIDNDLAGTDFTFGFDTAVTIATEAIDRLRTTGESHRRCMVLEVMGREAGWIALHAGMAGGAQVILLPEFPESIDQICEWVESVRDRGRTPLVVVAEGFRLDGMETAATRDGLDGFGRPRLGGIAEVLAPLIESRTGIESRATVLGHVQRGGVPTAFDRVLATRAGIKAADAVAAHEWGMMVGMHANEMEMVPLDDAVSSLKAVPEARYEEVRLLFG
ncbi:MAG: 6-phosphofructokinase [Leucobacter sp.]